MEPKAYILSRKITIAKLAKILRVSRPHLTNVLNGKTPAGKLLARRLQKWSNGAISDDDLLKLLYQSYPTADQKKNSETHRPGQLRTDPIQTDLTQKTAKKAA